MLIIYIVLVLIPSIFILIGQNRNYIISLGCGFIAAFLCLYIEFIITEILQLISVEKNNLLKAFFIAAMPEEIIKFLILTSSSVAISKPKDIIYLFLLMGLGFASAENIIHLKSFSSIVSSSQLTDIFLTRYFLPLPLHLTCGVISSTGLVFKRVKKHAGIVIAILFHGVYDFFAFMQTEDFISYQKYAFIIMLLGLFLLVSIIKNKNIS